jgi:hypothetical protein
LFVLVGFKQAHQLLAEFKGSAGFFRLSRVGESPGFGRVVRGSDNGNRVVFKISGLPLSAEKLAPSETAVGGKGEECAVF